MLRAAQLTFKAKLYAIYEKKSKKQNNSRGNKKAHLAKRRAFI
jgi:hypothetical protein